MLTYASSWTYVFDRSSTAGVIAPRRKPTPSRWRASPSIPAFSAISEHADSRRAQSFSSDRLKGTGKQRSWHLNIGAGRIVHMDITASTSYPERRILLASRAARRDEARARRRTGDCISSVWSRIGEACISGSPLRPAENGEAERGAPGLRFCLMSTMARCCPPHGAPYL